MYREERDVTPVPTLQCVIVIYTVVSRGYSGVQGEEVCDAAPYITVCYCYIPSGIPSVQREEVCDATPYITVCYCYIPSGIPGMFKCTERRGV